VYYIYPPLFPIHIYVYICTDIFPIYHLHLQVTLHWNQLRFEHFPLHTLRAQKKRTTYEFSFPEKSVTFITKAFPNKNSIRIFFLENIKVMNKNTILRSCALNFILYDIWSNFCKYLKEYLLICYTMNSKSMCRN